MLSVCSSYINICVCVCVFDVNLNMVFYLFAPIFAILGFLFLFLLLWFSNFIVVLLFLGALCFVVTSITIG